MWAEPNPWREGPDVAEVELKGFSTEYADHGVIVPAPRGFEVAELVVTDAIYTLPARQTSAEPKLVRNIGDASMQRIVHASGTAFLLRAESMLLNDDSNEPGQVTVSPLSSTPPPSGDGVFNLFELLGYPQGNARTLLDEEGLRFAIEMRGEAVREEAERGFRRPICVSALAAMDASRAPEHARGPLPASLVLLCTQDYHVSLLRLGNAHIGSPVVPCLASAPVPNAAARVDLLSHVELALSPDVLQLVLAESHHLAHEGGLGSRGMQLVCGDDGRLLAALGLSCGEVIFLDMTPPLPPTAPGASPTAAPPLCATQSPAPPRLVRRVRAHGMPVRGVDLGASNAFVAHLVWHPPTGCLVSGGGDSRVSVTAVAGWSAASADRGPDAGAVAAVPVEAPAHTWVASDGWGAPLNYKVTNVAVAEAARVAATASQLDGGHVMLWELPAGRRLCRLEPARGIYCQPHVDWITRFRVHGLALTADGSRVVIVHANGGMNDDEPLQVEAAIPAQLLEGLRTTSEA